MRIKDILMIQRYLKQNRSRSVWRRLVRMMACVVVFCTVYALILPVITIEQTYICGMDVHEHTDQCRAGPQNGSLLCTPESLGVHSHSSECYTADGVLQCGMAEKILHEHNEFCVGADGELKCRLPGLQEHLHSDGCWSDDTLICGRQAISTHSHDASCRDESGSLICGILTADFHIHTEDCPVLVAENTIWICGMEEHTHTDTCLAQEPIPETTAPVPPTEPVGSDPAAPVGDDPGAGSGTEMPGMIQPAPPEQIGAAVAPAKLTLRFTSYSQWNAINFPNGNVYNCHVGDEVTIRLKDTNNNATYEIPELTASGCQLVSVSSPCSQGHGSHNDGSWYNCGFTHEIVIRITAAEAGLTASIPGDDWPTAGNSVTIKSTGDTEPTDPPETEPTDPPETDPTDPPETDPTDPPETEPTEPEEPEIVKPGYPTAVKTGKSRTDTLYFYNFEATSSAVKPLAGCIFEIRSTDGSYVRRITSGDALEVELPSDIPVGDYTITEVSAPYGYLRDDDYVRSFSVGTSATLGGQKVFKNNSIGSFMNHSLDDVNASKTAEVENYNNRTYEIILSAGASVKLYEMDPIDILFVVDQSNSMLFPSGLNDTGKRVRLHQNSGWNNNWNIDRANLDKNQLYYIIADPQGTSTVFALWHNGTSWMYQDASYYAKAFYDNAEGYRQDNETAAFPKANQGFQGTWTDRGVNYKANGGDIGYDLGGSLGSYIGDGGNREFAIYTAANQYNRLHYLQESITQSVYQLSDANVENTVTLIRFTKEVDSSHCMGPLEMTPENANRIVDAVNKIQTDGGTRQDIALQHAYDHLTGNVSTNDGGWGDHYTKDPAHTFTVLITDGAPVRSGSDAPALDTIYQQIRTNGAKVRQESTLVTIGLGMGAVEGGKKVLEDIASEPHSMYANMLDDASDLTGLLYDLIFSSMTPREHPAVPGAITDVISDSFYPIAWVSKGTASSTGRQLLFSDDRDWVILEPGDWIDVNGRYIGPAGTADAEGQLTRETNGDLVIRWSDRQLKGNPSWTGRFYVKAKEDFIGGNAIDTNKRANVEVRTTDSSVVLANIDLPTPTVNVRLLDMNRHNSEVTVFLGDLINEAGNSPLSALEYFYHNTRFTKLISDLPNSHGMDYGSIMNAVDPDAASDGLDESTFTLAYAMGKDLTAEQWAHLMASADNTVRVEYTYDDDSSHGPVGYFTFRLTKSGDTADYQEHEATVAGMHVEDYILHVTYTAYELGDNRPDRNVYNGSGSPGTEVADENGEGRLEEGYGIVDKDNVHIVHVIEGAIEVTKEITPELVSGTDQIFSFTLHRSEDGEDHTGDRHLEILIPAGQTTATVRAEHLPRGTWVLTEQASDAYNIRSLTILDTTNCYSLKEGNAAIFHIGDDRSDRNVIGRPESERYTSYTGSPEGVFGAAKVVNEKTVYYAEIPVQKAWAGSGSSVYRTGVYVVLYRTVDGVDQLVLDTAGHARLLWLDVENGWQATFRVAVPTQDTDVTTLGYFVREVSGVSATPPDSGQSAILENDGTTLLYYTYAGQPEDILELNGKYFMVTYGIDETGTHQVTNHIAVAMPSTGGHGTAPYQIGGLLLIAAALILGYSQRRRREGGAA